MPVKTFRPLTPSRRYLTIASFDEITKTKPEKKLVQIRKRTGGRNSYGRVTARAVGGGHKRKTRNVDFKRIKARDGRDLPVWLTHPKGTANGAAKGTLAPAVVLVHGGPFVRGGQWAWNPMAQFLASRGYLVIEPEFRGSKGYGDAHFKAGFGSRRSI